MTPITEFNFIDLGPDPAEFDLPVLTDSTYAVYRVIGGDEASIHYTVKEVVPLHATALSDRKVTVDEAVKLLQFYDPRTRQVLEYAPDLLETYRLVLDRMADDGKLSLRDALDIGLHIVSKVAKRVLRPA